MTKIRFEEGTLYYITPKTNLILPWTSSIPPTLDLIPPMIGMYINQADDLSPSYYCRFLVGKNIFLIDDYYFLITKFE